MSSKVVVCPHCNVKNKVDADRLKQAVCGKCGSLLFSRKPIPVDAAHFERFLTSSEVPFLVDFWAPWCGPCRMMAPAFEEAASILEPDVLLVKVDTQAESALGARFQIQSIPTMALFRQGREVSRISGAMNAQQIVDWTRRALSG
ncbi:thioredoxin TrxC [Desulfovibrio inopinatus]|uniref:thioredoxin TrxC n=1 Tax=Desulfovibrio inopinatus TaxID=102109 RepID=UPI00041B5294|nr:thioredoxin TrxC [Desulfovibrio inopinatus]